MSHPSPAEMDAYERVLGDAMEGDATLFAREDYVEEAWRIVDPVLKAGTPVYEYEPNTWGPAEAARSPRRWLAEPDCDKLGLGFPGTVFQSARLVTSFSGDALMKIEVLADADAVAKRAAAIIAAEREPPWRRGAGSSWLSAAATLLGSCYGLWRMKTFRGKTCIWFKWMSAWPLREIPIAISLICAKACWDMCRCARSDPCHAGGNARSGWPRRSMRERSRRLPVRRRCWISSILAWGRTATPLRWFREIRCSASPT